MTDDFQSLGQGRVLHLSATGFLYFSKGYEVYRTPVLNPMGTVAACGRLPGRTGRHILGRLRPMARLLRYEVKALLEAGPDALVASIREGLFWSDKGSAWSPSTIHSSGNRNAKAPMRINVTPGGDIIWGEYGRNMDRDPVSVYVSENGGRDFEAVYEFEAGDIRHIHNVIPTLADDGYWVLSGDYGQEPGIAHLSRDFSTLRWLARGHQQVRAVHLFEEEGHLIYGTDTETEQNQIVKMGTARGSVTPIQPLPGSSLYGCKFGAFRTLSTTVEPSKVNRGKSAQVWLQGLDGSWNKILSGEKDRLPGLPFQFGSWVLPTGATTEPIVFVSGQSLRGRDQEILMLDLRKSSFWVE